MGIGAGIFLIAVGAILKFAVARTYVGGLNIATVGVILMVAGVAGVLFDLLFWAPTRRRRTTVVDDGSVQDDVHVIRR